MGSFCPRYPCVPGLPALTLVLYPAQLSLTMSSWHCHNFHSTICSFNSICPMTFLFLTRHFIPTDHAKIVKTKGLRWSLCAEIFQPLLRALAFYSLIVSSGVLVADFPRVAPLWLFPGRPGGVWEPSGKTRLISGVGDWSLRKPVLQEGQGLRLDRLQGVKLVVFLLDWEMEKELAW